MDQWSWPCLSFCELSHSDISILYLLPGLFIFSYIVEPWRYNRSRCRFSCPFFRLSPVNRWLLHDHGKLVIFYDFGIIHPASTRHPPFGCLCSLFQNVRKPFKCLSQKWKTQSIAIQPIQPIHPFSSFYIHYLLFLLIIFFPIKS